LELPINFSVAIAGEGDKIPENKPDLLVPAMLDKREPYKINRFGKKKDKNSQTERLDDPAQRMKRGGTLQRRQTADAGDWRLRMATKPLGLKWTEGGESNGEDEVAIRALEREIGAKQSP